MTHITRRFLVVGSLTLVLIAALAFAARTFAGQMLEGSRWTATQIDGQPPVAGGPALMLSFEADGRLSGHSGCNGYGGAYAVNGSALTLSEMMGTLMACADDPLNAQESAFLQALSRVAAYDLAGDTLTLKDANGAAVLVLVRA